MNLEKGWKMGLWTSVVTTGWIRPDNLIQGTREDGVVVCPFIQNRRGLTFLRDGDYIITEKDMERHVCGKDKFFKRYQLAEE